MIYKLFHKDPNSRDDIVVMTSGLGVVVNALIAIIKVALGALTSSIAIASEGVNNLTDSLTSVLTLVGAKLAKKRPDEKHPFGYGRIEYFASLVIAVFILVTGVEMTISSVKLVVNPAETEFSTLTIAIVGATAVVKYFLGVYTIKMGRKATSGSLVGVGMECRNDSFASAITIGAALVYLLFHVSLDAYAGILISLLIVKTGVDVLRDALAELLGRPGDKELAKEIYREIRKTPGVVAAADLMLHDYGPDAWSGSVNVEIDHKKTVGEVFQLLHEIQLGIMHKHKVTMVFGVYAVDDDHEEMKKLRTTIARFIETKRNVKSYHALYIDPKTRKIYCDFIVDYELRDWDLLRKEYVEYMAQEYPGSEIDLTVETEFV